MGPGLYSLVFGVNATVTIIGGVVFQLFVTRAGAVRLRAVGRATSTASAVTLALAVLAAKKHTVPLPLTWSLLSAIALGVGLIVPASTVLAQFSGRRAGGTAAALQGGGTFLLGPLANPLAGIVGAATLLPLAGLMCILMTGRRSPWRLRQQVVAHHRILSLWALTHCGRPRSA